MEGENTGSKKYILVPVVLALLVLLAGGYFLLGNKGGKEVAGGDLGPGVATVNGTVIPSAIFDAQLASAIAAYKTQGVDVTDATKLSQIKTQVLDNLINNELVAQGVVSAGIKASAEEVEKQFQFILTQTGGADKLKVELVKSNLTEDQLRQNIAKQLAIQAYLLQNIDTKSIVVTDAEIATYYADYSKAQKDAGQKTVLVLKELSEQIKQQLTADKQQAMAEAFVGTLRAKAKIELTAK